jgi:UDP-2,4-diacetamido-2,4,6-trideoxy-beta-L-altropyranose hydrolase
MRCLTLANALKNMGAECLFIHRLHPGHLTDTIEQNGYKVFVLPSPDRHVTIDKNSEYELWLGVHQDKDAAQTINALDETSVDWLVVDHYSLDNSWEKSLRPHVRKIMVIDDLANRSHDCDLLLDQTYKRKQEVYKNLVPDTCKLLTGSDYALLRPEFPKWRNYSLRRRFAPETRRLLISMGGMDPHNYTGKILDALESSDIRETMDIQIIIGASTPHLKEIQCKVNRLPSNVNIRINPGNIAELMANSDLAIGAAGSTSWERCCLGLPTILFVLDNNQKIIASNLEKAGAVIVAESIEQIVSIVTRSINTTVLKKLSRNASRICDGEGTNRVSGYLVCQKK